jgi:hypothetical protein
MSERYRGRRGGSIVFPIILITLGVLFLLDNLNIIGDIDWSTIWRLWPIVLIAFGLEIILGRRVSFGVIFLVIFLVLVGGAFAFWTTGVGVGDLRSETFTWPLQGVERAEARFEVGVGALRLAGAGDLGELLAGDVQLPDRAELVESVQVTGGVANGRVSADWGVLGWPRFFGARGGRWDLRLNERVSWDLDVDTGVGEARLDLSDLLVTDLNLNSGVGAVEVTLPRRGMVEANVDGGVGEVVINIPEGREARIRVERGIGGVDVDSRFERRGDFYETDGVDSAESYIDLEVNVGVGSITID